MRQENKIVKSLFMVGVFITCLETGGIAIFPADSELKLVAFQDDGCLGIDSKGSKVPWKSMVGKHVQVEGLIYYQDKNFLNRIILDNTSLYVLWNDEVRRPESGTSARVEGKFRSIQVGGAPQTSGGGGSAARAYAIEVSGCDSRMRVTHITVAE